MSKRFGRNQRRRLRERVASLEVAHQMDAALLSRQSNRLSILEAGIKDAVCIAGEMSILFPATTTNLDSKGRDIFNIPVIEKRPDYNSFSDRIPECSVFQVQRLNVMLARLEQDKLRRAIHIKVNFSDGLWGYALSEEAIYSTPKNILSKLVTRALGDVIGPELKQFAKL